MTNLSEIWIGLFSNVDIICRPDIDKLLQLRGLKFDELGKEYILDKTKIDTVANILDAGDEWVGGNAGNSAYFLGTLGLESNLSMTHRFKNLTSLFHQLPVYVYGIRKKFAADVAQNDKALVHWVAEVAPPLSKEAGRIIFTPKHSHKLWHDSGFFNHMKDGLFYLSGLHLMESENDIKELADLIEDRRKHLQVYLEFGEPNKMMKFGFEYLTRRQLIDAVGMNDIEARILGVESGYPSRVAEHIEKFKEQRGLEITVHSSNWVYSTKSQGVREALDLVEAWALDDIGLFKTMGNRPLWTGQEPAVPARKLPEILRKTGLGDAFGILDAMRLLAPNNFKEAISLAANFKTEKIY